jgi:hypothetical protein
MARLRARRAYAAKRRTMIQRLPRSSKVDYGGKRTHVHLERNQARQIAPEALRFSTLQLRDSDGRRHAALVVGEAQTIVGAVGD